MALAATSRGGYSPSPPHSTALGCVVGWLSEGYAVAEIGHHVGRWLGDGFARGVIEDADHLQCGATLFGLDRGQLKAKAVAAGVRVDHLMRDAKQAPEGYRMRKLRREGPGNRVEWRATRMRENI